MNDFKLRFIPLGGIVDVTKNMYLYELYENNTLVDILIVDCGIGFPKEKELGIDFVIPDISYLEGKMDKVRAVLLTHGHEDHITALRFHYDKLGRPPIFGSRLTAVLTEAKFAEFGLSVKVNEVDYKKDYQLGRFTARFIQLTHSIPDATHILIKTPVGNFYHGADFKFDLTPPYGPPPNFSAITKAGDEGILCLLSDCLGAENEGLTLSEKIVGKTFDDEMRQTKGKFFMTTFSSNISRIRQCVEAAIKYNRKICFLGRSVRENTRLAKTIGYLPIPEKFLIREEEVNRFAANKVCFIIAGSQGQFNSALSKVANNENKNVKIKDGDRVIFSSDPIPGSENEVYNLIERLSLLKATVVYSDIHNQLHASGHGNQEDLKFLIRFTNPRYLLPIGGTIRHQRQYLELAKDLGYHERQVVLLQEGETYWFGRDKGSLGQSIKTKNIYVDAYGVGDVGNVILRDRQTLAKEGMVVLNLIIDQSGQLLIRPQFISRGFTFGKDEKIIFAEAEKETERLFNLKKPKKQDVKNFKHELIKSLESFFHKKTGREPLVVVEIIEI